LDGFYAMHKMHDRITEPAVPPIQPEPPMPPAPPMHEENQCFSQMELAQAYVRPQPMEEIFPPEEGLLKGTIFPSLYQPYEGGNKR